MKIALMVTPLQPLRIAVAKEVCKYLAARGAEMLIHENNRDSLCGQGTFYTDFEKMMSDCDLIVAVGGDGTMIHASKHAAAFGKPVAGVNSGRMGYLTAMESNELHLLDHLLDGTYTVEKRMMLSACINGSAKHLYYALNDVVIASGSIAKVVEIAIRCDGRSVMNYGGDGVIFATPTGSTAYAFSAGGPVIDPTIECISVTPICPHTSAYRTVIFSAGDCLNISAQSAGGSVYTTIDGEEGIPLSPTDTVTVEKSNRQALLIRIKDEKFNDVLSKKMKTMEGR